MSREEMRQMLEQRVREEMGMSLAEFEVALASGRLDPDEPRFADLAILLGA